MPLLTCWLNAGSREFPGSRGECRFAPFLTTGPLSESWCQQPGTPAYCTELDITKLKKALSAADAARAPKNRDELIKVFMTPDAHFEHEEVIARNREVTA